ncbi:hypothetical protein FNF29_02528 [Cafeteria roenbergensis]|uniref:Uncharacterized protein n=4 Tax=Cafeteria roenbergensis TaxID=33653 RepID=A0A5A8CM97_CAFRO|nr:hypothetical protein FNF28_06860 [Cafeteria roenbergensis]KAA0154308.1 hypothetical protein FNF29_02528 [Cafeteria roenbergensis]KAA0155531.1 hypothetical protein FNF31_06070 [Cafeteria roenbergensis]|eukprot:KAA0154308.1 hypothetical protein FNF29_02528 [Cafeteria roenbergensis]
MGEAPGRKVRKHKAKGISLVGKIVFALPAFALAAAMLFHHTYQTKFYVDDVGMSPQLFALVNAVVRSMDLFAYPVTGWIVDNSFVLFPRCLRGRRRPFFILLSPLVAMLFFFLYSPPKLTPAGAAVYYGGISMIYNMMPLSLSYNALGAELSDSYDEPGEVFGWKHAAACFGMMAGVLTPGIMSIFEAEDHMLSFPAFALFTGVLIVVLFITLAIFTSSSVTEEEITGKALSLKEARAERHNRAWWFGSLGALREKPVRLPRHSPASSWCDCILLGSAGEASEEAETDEHMQQAAKLAITSGVAAPSAAMSARANGGTVAGVVGGAPALPLAHTAAGHGSSADTDGLRAGAGAGGVAGAGAGGAASRPGAGPASEALPAQVVRESVAHGGREGAEDGDEDEDEDFVDRLDDDGRSSLSSAGQRHPASTSSGAGATPGAGPTAVPAPQGVPDAATSAASAALGAEEAAAPPGHALGPPADEGAADNGAGDPSSGAPQVDHAFLAAGNRDWELEAALEVPEAVAAMNRIVVEIPRPGGPPVDVPDALAPEWRSQCVFIYTVEAGERKPVDLSLQPHLLPLRPGGPVGAAPPPALPIVPGVNWAMRNTLLIVLLVSLMALSLSRIVSASLFAFYCEYVLRTDHYEWWLGLVLALELFAAAVSTPYWLWLSAQGSSDQGSSGSDSSGSKDSWFRSVHRNLCLVCGQTIEDMDQRLVFVIGTALSIPVVVIATFTLDKGDVLGFAFVMLFTGLTEGGCEFLIAALVKTAIDYDTRFTGLRREAQHLTYISVVTHWIDIPASSLVLSFLSSAGYAANAAEQPPTVVFLLKIFTLFVPALFMAISLAFAAAFPVGRRQHHRLFGLASSGEVVDAVRAGSEHGDAPPHTAAPSGAGGPASTGAPPHDDDGEESVDDGWCYNPDRHREDAGAAPAESERTGEHDSLMDQTAHSVLQRRAMHGNHRTGGGTPAGSAAPLPSAAEAAVPPADHLLSARAQLALARVGVLFLERDQVSNRLILPPEVRYAVSMGWLLDEFGLGLLEEVGEGIRVRDGIGARGGPGGGADGAADGAVTESASRDGGAGGGNAAAGGAAGAATEKPREGATAGDEDEEGDRAACCAPDDSEAAEAEAAGLLRQRATLGPDTSAIDCGPDARRAGSGALADSDGDSDGEGGDGALRRGGGGGLPAGHSVASLSPRVSLCSRFCACRATLWCRELTHAAFWTVLLVVSCAIVGVLTALDYAPSLALSVLLIVGGAGLFAMYHCLRIQAAAHVSKLEFRQIRRYLRTRQVCDGVSLQLPYKASAYDGTHVTAGLEAAA